MTKEIVEKITRSYTPLQTDDMSVEDKKSLYVTLAKKGLYFPAVNQHKLITL